MNHLKNLIFVLRISGVFNIIFSLPLMIPGLAIVYLNQMSELNAKLNLGGNPIVVTNDPVSLFLINAAGLCLVVIGFIVIYASKNPTQRTGIIWINIAGRMSFTIILAYYLFFENLIQIVALFGVIDLIFCVFFYYYLSKLADN